MPDLRSVRNYSARWRYIASCLVTSADGARKSRSASCSFRFDMRRSTIWILLCLLRVPLLASETWESALSRMPLEAGVTELSRTNCVEVMLKAFQSNDFVKALIFMPGATDEFYMFKRARAQLTNASPTLLDAVSAL